MKYSRPALSIALIALSAAVGCRHKPKAPPAQASTAIQGFGFALGCDSALFPVCEVSSEPRLSMEENGTDIPFDIGPKRVKFTLRQAAPPFLRDKAAWSQSHAFIRIFPLQDSSVGDFGTSYPDLASSAAAIRDILKAGTLRREAGKDLPDWNCIDCEQTIHAKARIVRGNWCHGIQYLTTYVQEAAEVDNGDLVYNFEGLSKDGRYYVALRVPLAHPSLPAAAPDIASAPVDRVKAYYSKVERRLDQCRDDSFYPPLSSIQAMIASIHPAP